MEKEHLCSKKVSMSRNAFTDEESVHGVVGTFLADQFPEMRKQFGYAYPIAR